MLWHLFFHFSPTPTVYWTRHNFTSLPSKAIQHSWGQELLIPNVTQSDEGIYECIGINSETDLPVIHRVNIRVHCKLSLPFLSAKKLMGMFSNNYSGKLERIFRYVHTFEFTVRA